MTITTAARMLAVACAMITIAACSTAPRTESTQDRSIEEIIADLSGETYPSFDRDRREDEEYRQAYFAEQKEVGMRRAALILELYKADPDNEQMAGLMDERWNAHSPDRIDAVRGEVAEVVDRYGPDTPLGARARATVAHFAMSDVFIRGADPDDALIAIERYIDEVDDDQLGAMLLFQLGAYGYEGGSEQQVRLLDHVRRTYADSEDDQAKRAARSAGNLLAQLAAIGDRFEFAFTCAVTGSEYDTGSLTGKVVVVDFWATWCGPCVAKMPEMKQLYDRYRDQGVEFIGISLDQPEEQGGLERLLTFVEENELAWPQWYLGNGWASEFSTEWGITGIPTLFIVDAQGRLRSTTARGKLDELIPELIAERDAALAPY